MIEINLLPGTGKKKAARGPTVSFGSFASGLSGRLTDKFMIAAFVGVVVSVGAVAFLYLSQQRRNAVLQARVEKAVLDSTRYANFLRTAITPRRCATRCSVKSISSRASI